MKITRKMLQERIARLNVVLGRPAEAWSKDGNGKYLRSNEGHFLLDTYSPGDGWTRYKLMQIVGESGGEREISHSCTASELWEYLNGVFAVLDSQMYHGDAGNFAKRGESDEYDNAVGLPDYFLSDVQRWILDRKLLVSMSTAERAEIFDTVAHARYLISENKPEDWPSYFAQCAKLPANIRHLRRGMPTDNPNPETVERVVRDIERKKAGAR